MMQEQKLGRLFSLGIQIEHKDVKHKPRMLAQAKRAWKESQKDSSSREPDVWPPRPKRTQDP